MSLIEYIKSNKLDHYSEIVFFGGSFNPWHEGHSACINLLPKSKLLIIIPDHNPYKELVKSNNKLTGLDEIASIVKDLRDNIYIYDGFYNQNKKNPTSIWINEVKKNFPNLNPSLLMGFDTFQSLEKWINSKDLLNNLYSVYVASRLENTKMVSEQESIIKNIAPNLKITFLGRHDFEDISSTELREKANQNEI